MSSAPSRLRRAATAPIRFYRRWISPLKPPMCRFSPTCSQYAVEAVEVHGLVRGSLLATWRLLRCQPFAKGGHDPVPPPRRKGSSGPPSDDGGDASGPAA